jgi:hypothetical protein
MHQTNRPLSNSQGILGCCLRHSILSKAGASEKSGAVHLMALASLALVGVLFFIDRVTPAAEN